VAGGEPIKKRTARVQVDQQRGVIGQRLDQRQITVAIDAFIDCVQISDRLMLVQDQDKAQAIACHG
jgi:hypothetical protein